jgi:hypothetical protein
LAAALALAAAPRGFTISDLTAKVQAMSGQAGYTRMAAYDLRKLRGKGLAENPADPAATSSRPGQPAPSPPC